MAAHSKGWDMDASRKGFQTGWGGSATKYGTKA